MDYEFNFVDSGLGIITNYYGVLTVDIILKSTAERFASKERNKKLRYILTDYSNVETFDIPSNAIITFANMAIEISKYNNNILAVTVMQTDLKYGMGRMWETYADKTGWESYVARTREEAENWIQSKINCKLCFGK